MPIKELLSEGKRIIDRALNDYLPKKGKLAAAMRYSVFAGGKRFRPILCLATAEALGKDPGKIIPIACAIEMLHTYTLIHDDLPAMDNSDYRRGKLTSHLKFDEATAILAGDALNTLAFWILAQETQNPRVIQEIGKSLMEVVYGQAADLAAEGKKLSFAALKSLHHQKTAALLIACVRASAIQLKSSPKQLKALSDYGRHLGLAFQIMDDILDVTATQKELGKPAGADVKKGFPYFIGLEKSKKIAEQEKNSALAALNVFDKRADILRKIAEYVVERKK